MSTPWKVYRDREFLASFRYPEDAAAMIAIGGGEVRIDHRALFVVYIEDGGGLAAESYDEAARLMQAARESIRRRCSEVGSKGGAAEVARQRQVVNNLRRLAKSDLGLSGSETMRAEAARLLGSLDPEALAEYEGDR